MPVRAALKSRDGPVLPDGVGPASVMKRSRRGTSVTTSIKGLPARIWQIWAGRGAHLLEEMIRFSDEHKDRFGAEAICRTLTATECGFITSRSYRAAKSRPTSARSLRDGVLTQELRSIHAENYGVYGYRKLWHAMARAGWDIGRGQVARLMRAAGIKGVRRGRRLVTTRPAEVPDHRPDLVDRRFAVSVPHRLWIAEIT